jgi:putative ATP-dependent endonuclease of the OLD family
MRRGAVVSTPREPSEPTILRLTIERYRCFQKFVWHPAQQANLILGGGDAGKTTILEAIGLLFNPTNFAAISDSDYWRREIDSEFSIEAVMFIPADCGINNLSKHAWPWIWDGQEPQKPKLDEEKCEAPGLPVYRVRVRGTAEMDLCYELIQPDESVDTFSVSLRRAIGLVRQNSDDRNDRDLRLVQGSALDRVLADKTLRARLGHKLAESDVISQLEEVARKKLEDLDTSFKSVGLPNELGLSFTGGQGLSPGALVGLTAKKEAIHLPLTSWGAGTRRLAALTIASVSQAKSPIVLVDEVERGLEPYRQRRLISTLEELPSQSFITTHSSVVVKNARRVSAWYLAADANMGALNSRTIREQKLRDPEAFLARLTIVAEGKTEVGFVQRVLNKTQLGALLEHGLWLTDGDGNERTLKLIEELAKSGILFAGFADNEGNNPDRWKSVKERLGPLLLRWETGCLEENILGLFPDDKLEDVIIDPTGDLTGERLRTLQVRLQTQDKQFTTLKAATPDLRAVIIAAATGKVPDSVTNDEERKAYRKHSGLWFKSEPGGRELATKAIRHGVLNQLESKFLPFVQSIFRALDLPEPKSLPQ